MEYANEPKALKPKQHQKVLSAKEKLTHVSKVIVGGSYKSVAIKAGISAGMLYQWVCKYKLYGYNGLINKPISRKSKEPTMKKLSQENHQNQMKMSMKS